MQRRLSCCHDHIWTGLHKRTFDIGYDVAHADGEGSGHRSVQAWPLHALSYCTHVGVT